jgi:hypothetical protein
MVTVTEINICALECREGTVKSMLFRSLQQMKLIMGVSKEAAS